MRKGRLLSLGIIVACLALPITRADTLATAVASTSTLQSNGDADNDGLTDEFETRYGLDPSSSGPGNGANDDPDGDGQTNLQEQSAGTHPRGSFTTYLAEGATGPVFDTRLAIANPTSSPALVLTRFQKGDGTTVRDYRVLPPMQRTTIDVEGLAGLEQAEFSTLVEADVQVVVDRAMSWDQTGYGSHAERGISTRTATRWYFAEGATFGNFSLFYLIQNPNTQAAQVKVTYLLPSGPPLQKTYVVAPQSRFNIWVDNEGITDPALAPLAAAELSAIVESVNGVPIIAERAMYLDQPGRPLGAGHESAGVTSPSTQWFLAEGATGDYFDLFLLIANPGPTTANVQADFLLTTGQVISKTYTVPGSSRFNIWVDLADPQLANAALSTRITSTNGVPIIVERSMWWPGPTSDTWQEAHNSPGEVSTGTRWAMAEGEVGGSRSTATYVLIANTSALDGQARVTVLFEDGTAPVTRTFPLVASSRSNVTPAADFPETAGKRFGMLVESIGATPAQIVVERAMYSDAGGVRWAAGTNALATKLTDVAPPTNGPIATVDTSRKALGAVTPASGGSVQAGSADGVQFNLEVAPGAVGATTVISIAPLTGISNLDAGPLVAGISAQPSRLSFQTPATLTITLPDGFTIPPFGLRGFIVDDDGQHLMFLPVRVSGNVVTMLVPHFSVAGVVINDDWFGDLCAPWDGYVPTLEHSVFCATIRPLYDAEVQRLATEGGEVDLPFKFDVSAALVPWMVNGLRPRAVAAQTADIAERAALTERLNSELSGWVGAWSLWGEQLTDRGNQAAGFVLGEHIDQFQEQYWRALEAAQQAAHSRCLADKAHAEKYVWEAFVQVVWWMLPQSLSSTTPWTSEYCVDLIVDAAPPPVLTAGTPALMPVDVRAQFSDGTDMPGVPLLVTMTATFGTVTPAGGTVVSPYATNVTLTPAASSASVTISAVVAESPGAGTTGPTSWYLRMLPPRSKVFNAGAVAPVTEGITRAWVSLLSSTRTQGFSTRPPIPVSALYTTTPALEPEVGAAYYTVSGPIAGPLTQSTPLEISTLVTMDVPGIVPASQERRGRTSFSLSLNQRAGFRLEIDLTCDSTVECDLPRPPGALSVNPALRITGPGFSIDEPPRNIKFVVTGTMEPGGYDFDAIARVRNNTAAGGASTKVKWTITPLPPER